MDTERFDSWTRALGGSRTRRAVVGVIVAEAAGVVSSASPSQAKKRKRKKRCQRAGRGCGSSKRCCRGLSCTGSACCPKNQVFVNCADSCLCQADPSFCCAEVADPPGNCPAGPENNPAFCCPAENVCGDICCAPFKESCVSGLCQCKPENVCGSLCCDPRFCMCNTELGICEDAPGQTCPSGTGGFTRVRRL
jgi:hypothetical protein